MKARGRPKKLLSLSNQVTINNEYVNIRYEVASITRNDFDNKGVNKKK
jgi:hypothetical protein